MLARRGSALVLGAVLVWLAFDAPAQDATAPAGGPAPAARPTVPVDIDKVDGTSIEGATAIPSLRLRTEIGTVELDIKHVATLLVEAKDGAVRATATLTDKTSMTGELLTPDLPLVEPKGTAPVPMAEVRQAKFTHPKDVSWTALIVGLVTLVLMEIVLGVDNIIFLTIISSKLPPEQQPRARRIGLIAALGTRLLLLATLSWLLGLTRPLFTLPALPWFESAEAREVSWRDLILLAGGLFLMGKSVLEMHEKLEHARAPKGTKPAPASFAWVIVQIAILDIIFSLDSVITAVGMVGDIWVMVTAVLISMVVMVAFAEPIARFVERRPTIKLLALSFLILIGVLLVAEGLGQHFDKGYVYFAMAFAVVMEMLNLQLRGTPHAGQDE